MAKKTTPETRPLESQSAEVMAAFEDRLRAIKPTAPSLELRSRLGRSLESRHWFARPMAIGLVGLAAAACLAAVVLIWPTTPVADVPTQRVASRQPSSSPVNETAEPVNNQRAAPMTLWAYHHAMRSNPESIDAIFEKRVVPHGPRQVVVRARPLTVMDANMFLYENERCDG